MLVDNKHKGCLENNSAKLNQGFPKTAFVPILINNWDPNFEYPETVECLRSCEFSTTKLSAIQIPDLILRDMYECNGRF